MSTLPKLDDWPERLNEYLTEIVGMPFVWGQHDCVLAALNAVKVMTGVDYALEIREKYSTALGAVRVMVRLYGVDSLSSAADVFCKKYEGEEVPISFAQRGDIVEADVVSAEGGTGPSLGVVDLDGIHALFAGPSGAIRIKITDCLRAWRVG